MAYIISAPVQARSFYDLASSTFRGVDKEPNIVFIDMPLDIRDKYQYFTEANMNKLRKAGYTNHFILSRKALMITYVIYLSAGKIW
jgi:ADP-L-glycero-D-manno-heptose 6-epimerase